MTFLRNLIKELDDTSRTALQILLLLAGVGIVISAVSTAMDSNSFWAWLDGAMQNFATEMMGAVVTFVLFELLVNKRKTEQEKAEALEKEKAALKIQMRVGDNATALNAVELLREGKWSWDGSLQGANLMAAKLQGANMRGANLQNAILLNVNIQSADLRGVTLKSAHVHSVNLQGADLQRANLLDADLQGVQFNNQTQLPDSTKENPSHWRTDTDMDRYTNPNHSEFWQPDWLTWRKSKDE